jgi:hypothetical protein
VSAESEQRDDPPSRGSLSQPRGAEARKKREAAALKYKPQRVRLLLVAEAPPAADDRYFYFEHVTPHDWLFLAVIESLFGRKPDKSEKARWLRQLREAGVFLIDLGLDPVDGSDPRQHVPDLVSRCKPLRPEHIILIKATVYDAAYHALVQAGLPVVDGRIPFPSTGQQGRFRRSFDQALRSCSWQAR